MRMIQEFKQFASKGNVVDLAVGIIIGAAFGKIVSSLVQDVIMPPLGILIGGVDFTDLSIILKPEVINDAGKVIAEKVTLNYGKFVQALFDFLIVAFAVFMLIKGINRLNRKKEAEIPTAPPAPTNEENLLSEIRDLLKEKK
jgi:large conductance mechanosensitive channel